MGIPNVSLLERLQAITAPVFVANGDEDRMILPRYSHLLAGLIDGAIIKIYPDSAHGFLFQHHKEFAADVHAFLDMPGSARRASEEHTSSAAVGPGRQSSTRPRSSE